MHRRALLTGVSALVAARALAQPVSGPVGYRKLPPGPANAANAGGGGGVTVPAPTLDLSFLTPGTLPTGVTFTRTSVGTYFDSAGVMQTAAANAPRWDYDPVTLALRGLLVEEPRTNLLLNSASLGTQSATVTAAATTLSFYGTGTVTLSGASTAGPLTGTGAFPQRVSLTFTPTAGSLTLTVTGSVLNAQLETGAFRTSWIPTTGSTVQRTLDTPVYVAAPLDANNGTLVAEVSLPQIFVANVEFATMDNGAVTDVMTVRQAGAGTAGTVTVWVANAQILTLNSPTTVVLGVNKVGLTYARGAPNAVTLATNGGAVVSGAPASLPTPTRLTFGTGRNSPVNGHVRRVGYWTTVLAPPVLQAATT
jgi:hypothetical protein